MNRNYGLKLDEITPEDYVLGGFGPIGQDINFSGQWLKWKPVQEVQKINGADTWACTSFGTLNCLETLLKFQGMEQNYSDRFLAIASGTELNSGNSPHKVAEFIRKNGVCTEELLPLTAETLEAFYTPNPPTPDLILNAQRFLDKFDFRHSYVFNKNKGLAEKQELLKDALRKSPVGISVIAWIFGDQYYFKPEGSKDNHWVALIGYEDGVKWIIFDSVDQDIKELEWDYDFEVAKVYFVTPKLHKEKTWRDKLRELLYNII